MKITYDRWSVYIYPFLEEADEPKGSDGRIHIFGGSKLQPHLKGKIESNVCFIGLEFRKDYLKQVELFYLASKAADNIALDINEIGFARTVRGLIRNGMVEEVEED